MNIARKNFIKATYRHPSTVIGDKTVFSLEYVHWLENHYKSTKINLKPCPFCGETVDISLKEKMHHGSPVEIEGSRFWYVECLPCDIRTGYCFDADAKHFGFTDGKEYAIHRWNTRKGK